MHALSHKYYFHPEMGGSQSLKFVFPAVWGAAGDAVRAHPALAEYVVYKEDALLNPYKALAGATKTGEDAPANFQRMAFDQTVGREERAGLAAGLENYCKLDTAAMLAVWLHWSQL